MTIFKQYGEERSGTNYLRRLIEINFPDAVVFGSVLGWKHGLLQLTNGYSSPSAKDHEDWVRQKRADEKVLSVDNYPLQYKESFLLEAARNLKYLISYKPVLPWLVSVKRFRFPKREYDRASVQGLFQRYIRNYETWLGMTDALVIHHDILIDEQNCRKLLEHLQTRHGLRQKRPELVIERRIVRASTDHGLLLGDGTFDQGYYTGRRYLDELPPWAVELSREARFCTEFIERAAWQPHLAPSALCDEMRLQQTE